MILATWNVNSVNVRLPAILQYLAEETPDVLVIQETKCIDENFPVKQIQDAGYYSSFCGQKTYNGVAIISKAEATDLDINPVSTSQNEMRSLSATFGDLRVVNLYVVNGKDIGTDKYDYKLEWLDNLIAYTKKSVSKYPKLVLMGDFNIAPKDTDVYHEASISDRILCSKPERKKLDELLSLGLKDLYLNFNFPDETYTWWDYRSGAFQRNQGYRIDLVLGSETVSKLCKEYHIDKKTRYKSWCLTEPRTSDHVPVRIIIE